MSAHDLPADPRGLKMAAGYTVPETSSGANECANNGARLVLLVEVLAVYGFIEAALWSEGIWRIRWSCIAWAAVMTVGLLHRDLWSRLGLGLEVRAALRLLLAGSALSTALLVGGLLAGTLHPLRHPGSGPIALAYPIWALQQQYLVQSYFLLRLELLFSRQRTAIIAAAGLFAFAHVPNPILVIGTFLMGLAFCSWFVRFRSIYPLAVVHAAMGLALAASCPESLLHRMRVGIGYLHYVVK